MVFKKKLLGVFLLILPTLSFSDQNLIQALEYYKNGDFEKSYELLREYIYKNQYNDKVVFAYARSAYEIGKIEEAELIYIQLLKHNSNNIRIKLELAQIYSKKPKNHFKANTIYQEILNSDFVPADVKNKVKVALSNLNTKEQNHFFSIFFGTGIGIDTNVLDASDTQFVDVPTPFGVFKFKTSEGKHIDKFIEYFLSLKHSSKLKHDIELSNKITLYSQKFKKEDSEDVDVASVETTVSKTDETKKQSLSVGYSRVVSDNKSHINVYTISPQLEYMINDDLLYKSKIKFIKKSYIREYDKFKNSKKIEFLNSLTYMTQDFGANTFEFVFGTEGADGEKKLNIDNNFMNFKYENFYPLTNHTVFISAIEYGYISYKIEEDFLYNLRRKDKQYVFDFSLIESFTNQLSVGLNYRYLNNDSNQGVYDYDKQLAKMSLFYSF